jgi:FAD-linked oxidoreductase
MNRWNNWAGTAACTPEHLHRPGSEDEVLETIRRTAAAGKTLRPVGSGHSFTPLAKTDEALMDLSKLSGLVTADKAARRATAWAGTRLDRLTRLLHAEGLAPENLGDIDVQTLAGAVSTGTHGTGTAFGNLATQVSGFTLATAGGELLRSSENELPDLFQAGRIALGALGVHTRMELRLLPSYRLEYLSVAADLDETLARLDEHIRGHRNFEFYWFPYTRVAQLKFIDQTEAPVKDNPLLRYMNKQFLENNVFYVLSEIGHRFPSATKAMAKACVAGFTREHITNYAHLIYATTRQVRFNEMEYNIPIEAFETVFRRLVARMEQKGYPVFFPWECRFVRGDDQWLSPAYGRDSAYIAVHTYHKYRGADEYFRDLEAIFQEHGGRPHWGKMHSQRAADFSRMYPKWDDFLALREKYDPNGVFLNPYLRDIFGV